jgi:L-ascorbate metabolism protein UlaG (beta-lactamase superfamily)
MVTAKRHLKILESFIAQPEWHRRAASDKGMRGAMVVSHAADAVAAMEHLLQETRRVNEDKLQFAKAIDELNDRLARWYEPTSLRDLYREVPNPLRGFVELVYDLQNRVTYRLVERLLYRSKLYDEETQAVGFSMYDERERPFALSTPRLEGPGMPIVRIPFRSPLLDEVFASRFQPVSESCIDELSECVSEPSGAEDIRQFFTTALPTIPDERGYTREGVRLRYFGHASVLIQSNKAAVLLDPLLSYPPLSRTSERFSLVDLPDRIDFVLLTHSHQDHVYLESLLQIRHRVGTVVVPRCASGALQDPSLKLMLEAIGFSNVVELDELEALEVPGGAITGIPFWGEHADLDVRAKLAYHLRLEDRRFLFLADSAALEPELYERLETIVGELDGLFVGLECDGAPLTWLYGPLYTQPVRRAVDQSRRLNSSDSQDALRIIGALKPKKVYVYAMGLEPWLGHVSSISYTPESRPITESERLIDLCRREGTPAQKLFMIHEEFF